MRKSCFLLMACAPALLAGCVGQNRVGAFTTDNLGLSMQSSMPNPQIDISYGRQEGAVEPVFEDGATPAVAASVQHSDTAMHLGADIKSIFATGNAAISATGGDPSKDGNDAVACIHTSVDPTSTPLYQQGQTGPLFFGTDTVFGLKASVSTGNSPNLLSGKLGYHRQEVSFAPVFQVTEDDPDAACSHISIVRQAQTALDDANKTDPTKEGLSAQQKANVVKAAQDRLDWLNGKPGADGKDGKDGLTYSRHPVYVPSTFASASDSIGAADAQGTLSGSFKVAQVFATGKAAEIIAAGPGKGAIAAVARSISPPDNSGTVAGPTFVVTGTSATAVAVSLSPNLPGKGSFTPASDPITYTSKSSDTAATIAAGLAKAFNADATASALGLRAAANAKDATVALSIPKNLSGFFPANFAWNPSPASGTVTVTPKTSP